VIGAEGFGFERDSRGQLHRFPHLGLVRIGDDVEVGARTCIDRGALGDTSIGPGTKIDDAVYIAHNVHIGRDCLIMAQTALCGSCVIGDRVEISPGAVVRDKVRIGDGARIGLGAVVVKDVVESTTVVGVPARPLGHSQTQTAQTAQSGFLNAESDSVTTNYAEGGLFGCHASTRMGPCTVRRKRGVASKQTRLELQHAYRIPAVRQRDEIRPL